jgi:hypothetical protein
MRKRAPRRSFKADLSSFDSANNYFSFAFPASRLFEPLLLCGRRLLWIELLTYLESSITKAASAASQARPRRSMHFWWDARALLRRADRGGLLPSHRRGLRPRRAAIARHAAAPNATAVPQSSGQRTD